ncbi:M20/M25/M40 family metallo-hydrolase [bacterium 210820-DFI.6.37]|nr:M20/M25/M40 family metallo-hydrolase [bacterium 210820-DFI.6.37]
MEKKYRINEKRIGREFSRLCALDSESFSERAIADQLTEALTALGFEVEEDHAGERYGGTAGNLYGFLKGELPGEPLLLSAHMDTVKPGVGKKAVFLQDGTITSQGDTVLGADDLNGITEILEGIRGVREAGLPHRDIEILFSIAEEVYVKGSSVFDFSRIRSSQGYVLDMSGAVGKAAVQAPSMISFEAEITGRAAHAGFEPERGIHAIQLMSHAISRIHQGHLYDDTTFNVGLISGGTATNIVPEACVCQGEVRSYDHQRAVACIEDFRWLLKEITESAGAAFRLDTNVVAKAYKIDEAEPVVQRFYRACKRLGILGTIRSTFGGSDNNTFVTRGIRGIVLSCGMYQVHSVEEYTTLKDLKQGAALVAELITDAL